MLKYAVRDLKMGHSQEALPIFGFRKMHHHWGYPYINNQHSSLVDISYANYRCHEPERIDVSIGGSIAEILGLMVRWMFTDANSLQGLLVFGRNRAKDQTIEQFNTFLSIPLKTPYLQHILAQTGFPGQPFCIESVNSVYSDSIDFHNWTQKYTEFDHTYLKRYLC